MCCTPLAGNAGRKKSPTAHHCTNLSSYIFASNACIDNRKNLLNVNISTCPYSMANFSPLMAEIGSGVWGTRQISTASLVQRCRSQKANQNLYDVWLSSALVHYMYIFGALAPWWNFAACKIHFVSKSCFPIYWQYICTALQQRGQPNFVAWYKKWNYGTFAWGATCLRLGGHHVGHRPTF